MSQVVSLRLPDRTAERLKESARRAGRSVNEIGALSIEEWLRQNEFAELEFRSFGGERHACITGYPPRCPPPARRQASRGVGREPLGLLLGDGFQS